MDLYQKRWASGERDYVHEEIAAALKSGVTVIPVLIEGAQLPRADALPEDIRELVLHHKQDVTHEHFGQNVAALVTAIKFTRQRKRGAPLPPVPWGWISASILATSSLIYVGAHQFGVPVPWPGSSAHAPLQPTKEQLETAARKSIATEEKAQRVPKPGQSFRDCNDGCPEMVVVPAGIFTMGSPSSEEGRSSDEGPQREVKIDQPLAVGKFEVTFEEWNACANGGGCTSNRIPADQGWGEGRRPVINVSWTDAKAYVAWLSRKTGKPYRLLTEAEWEYSARAGSSTRFYFGDSEAQLSAYAWYSANSGSQTHPVGAKRPNAFGLYDMHGNVWEWVEDCWYANYSGAPSNGSARTIACSDATSRVLRGGSWSYDPQLLRSAGRDRDSTGNRSARSGFRVGRAITP